MYSSTHKCVCVCVSERKRLKRLTKGRKKGDISLKAEEREKWKKRKGKKRKGEMEREKRRSIEKGFVISVYWCCAVSMATGTKACGWPLMANCILHSSFVNCCLPSSHFLLGHGTKPRTGGIRNGTSAPPMHGQALSTSFALSLSFSLLLSLSLSFFLYLSVPIEPRLLLSSPHRVHSHDLAKSFSLSLS